MTSNTNNVEELWQLNILKKLYGEVIVPEAVYGELSVKEESACKRAVDSSLDWIRVDEIKNQMAKAMYKTQLLILNDWFLQEVRNNIGKQPKYLGNKNL